MSEKMEYEELLQVWDMATSEYDLYGRAACIIEVLNILRSKNDNLNYDLHEFFDDKVKILIYAALDAISSHDGKLAKYYLSFFQENKLEELNCLPDYRYWFGRAAYEQKDWQEAEFWFKQQVRYDANDELAWFFLGNCYMKRMSMIEALSAYAKSIELNPTFREAQVNAAIAFRAMGDTDTAEELFQNLNIISIEKNADIVDYPTDQQLYHLLQNPDQCYDVPIFINSRDRLESLKKLVTWLILSGYKNIIILDNASTYQPLLEYYHELALYGIRIFYLRRNIGHKALWESKLLSKLQVQGPYVYTDSDVLPGIECGKDIVYQLVNILSRYRWLKKAGTALAIKDITFFDRERVQRTEKSFWYYPIAKNVFFAPVDTTFALYRPYRRYVLQESIRLGGSYTFKHLPWYYDYQNLLPDESYYLKHARESSTLATFYNEVNDKV